MEKVKYNLKNDHYDYLIVGAGLFGSATARILSDAGKRVLVIEKLPYIGGTCHTKEIEGIHVHEHGAHIFRTNDRNIYDFVQRFTTLNTFVNSPIAIYNGQAYNMPFNMNTFAKVWPITTPEEAKEMIDNEIKLSGIIEPKNLEEKAISLIGKTLYEMFIKDYSEKQWGKSCVNIDKDVIRRIPVRFTYNNNYYNAKYQGIPIGGYTKMFEKILDGIETLLSVDYFEYRESLDGLADHIIFTGAIDEYYGYCYGELEYRGLKFVEKIINVPNYQGNAVLNWCDKSVSYTRSIEHKHFDDAISPITVVSYEYPIAWKKGEYQYYPVNNEENDRKYNMYKKMATNEKKIIFGGRLGGYQYYDMQDTIKAAFELCNKLLQE